LVLRLDCGYLAKKITAITGRRPRLWQAESGNGPNRAGAIRLERLIRFFADEIGPQSPLPSLFQAEMEQAIAAAFLLANPQLHAKEPQGCSLRRPGYRQLCRAVDYIDAHWDQALTLEALAAATNVSIRSLFHYFRMWQGCTPMQYLKEVRLAHARDTLQNSPEVTVTEVAFACGFGNLGHFARNYRKFWGELPSETKWARRKPICVSSKAGRRPSGFQPKM
jgi:AraC-like DNA-binding protein